MTVPGPNAVRNHLIFFALVAVGFVLLLAVGKVSTEQPRLLGLQEDAQSQPLPQQPVQQQRQPPAQTNPFTFSGPPSALPAAYRDLLTATGWFPYVRDSAVDVIQLYDWSSFAHPAGPTTGLITYDPQCRLIQVATHGRSIAAVTGEIVLSSARMNSFRQVGRFTQEDADAASGLQRRFLRDARRLERSQERDQCPR